jgi:hypothetical protein
MNLLLENFRVADIPTKTAEKCAPAAVDERIALYATVENREIGRNKPMLGSNPVALGMWCPARS